MGHEVRAFQENGKVALFTWFHRRPQQDYPIMSTSRKDDRNLEEPILSHRNAGCQSFVEQPLPFSRRGSLGWRSVPRQMSSTRSAMASRFASWREPRTLLSRFILHLCIPKLRQPQTNQYKKGKSTNCQRRSRPEL